MEEEQASYQLHAAAHARFKLLVQGLFDFVNLCIGMQQVSPTNSATCKLAQENKEFTRVLIIYDGTRISRNLAILNRN
jgi:hypothetical protein